MNIKQHLPPISFFAGDASLPQKKEMEPHQKALPHKLTVDVSK